MSTSGIRSIGAASDPAMAMAWLREQLDNAGLAIGGAVAAVVLEDGTVRYATCGSISRQDVAWLGGHLQNDALNDTE